MSITWICLKPDSAWEKRRSASFNRKLNAHKAPEFTPQTKTATFGGTNVFAPHCLCRQVQGHSLFRGFVGLLMLVFRQMELITFQSQRQCSPEGNTALAYLMLTQGSQQ